MPPRRRKSQQAILTGVEELDAMLKAVGTKVGNRAARAVLAKAVRLAVKKIKAKVPSSQKSVRKAIGGNVKKRKGGADRGLTTAKAGAAVGMKSKARLKSKRGGKPGVGIGPENVHWFILGTDERTVKSTGQNVGKMPAHPIIKEAMAAGGGEIVALMKRELRPAIERETNKERARLIGKHMRKGA